MAGFNPDLFRNKASLKLALFFLHDKLPFQKHTAAIKPNFFCELHPRIPF